MSITIITVTYNSSRYINNFIKSIIAQGYQDKIEIVIVDNCSDDLDILKKIINRHTNSKLLSINLIIRKKNYGFSSSCNYGFRHSNSQCKYVAFINPDTRVYPGAIPLIINHMKSNNVHVAGGKVLRDIGNDTHRTVFRKVNAAQILLELTNVNKLFTIKSKFYYDQKDLSKDKVVDGISGAFMIISKEIFKNLGGFDERYFMYLEDVDFCYRCKSKFINIMYCPHAVIRHIGGASSTNLHKIHYNSWYNSRNIFVLKNYVFPVNVFLYLFFRVEEMLLEFRRKLLSS